MAQNLNPTLNRFANDERGGVAVIFAAMLIPLITIISLSIDYGRALKVNSEISSAADAATAAVLFKLPASADDLMPFVRRQLDANLPEHLKNLPFELNISESKRIVELSVKTEVPTAVIALVGIDRIDVNVVSTQRIPKAPKSIPGLQIPGNARDAEDAMRRALDSFRPGGGSDTPAVAPPAPEEVAKATEEINKQVQEALDSIGKGNVDFDAIKQALGNR